MAGYALSERYRRMNKSFHAFGDRRKDKEKFPPELPIPQNAGQTAIRAPPLPEQLALSLFETTSADRCALSVQERKRKT
jgi:hypothetical protein